MDNKTKKFIDLHNLEVLWRNVSDKFLRKDEIEYLQPKIYIPAPDEKAIGPEIEGQSDLNIGTEIPAPQYDKFIEFVNTPAQEKFIQSSSNNIYHVVSKVNKIGDKYTGVIINSQDVIESKLKTKSKCSAKLYCVFTKITDKGHKLYWIDFSWS